jgi:hypothetical protein
MILGIFLLVCIFFLWKLLVDGWLYKVILFFAGWVGLYVICNAFLEGGKRTAVTVGGQGYSLSFVIATGICVLCLLTTRVKND